MVSPPGKEVSGQEAIKKYMDDLKSVFQGNRPGKKETKSLEQATPGKVDPIKALKKLRDEQVQFLEAIKKLTPPDKETKKIHQLALSIVTKLQRVTELGITILSTPKDQDNPRAREELMKLNREIIDEEADFNRRVLIIREKYKLGPP